MTMTRGNTFVYMVRHAESPYVEGQERTRELSAAGMDAAGVVAKSLRDADIQVFYSSPYRRAIQTLEELAAISGHPIHLREDLRETDFGTTRVDMTSVQKMYNDPTLAFPEGESNQVCQERAAACLLAILREHEGERIAIGTHGNVMTLMMGYFDPAYAYDFLLHTSKPDIYRLEIAGSQLVEVVRLWEA